LSINLALILTILTAVSGVVVAFNRFYYMNRQAASDGKANIAVDTVIEYCRSFFPVLLFVLVIRSFIFEPFRIPSGSMMPTLFQGDFIFVKKYTYGLRLPVIEEKIYETGEPERGDVVVFRLPSNPSINYIKRVVGLPGDRIVYANHQIMVNGVKVALNRDAGKPVELVWDRRTKREIPMARWIEELGDRKHAILIANAAYSVRDNEYIVPEGEYFMMGDNRNNSSDSRFIGTIPESYLVGEAVRIWMHVDLSEGLEWPDWGRIGTKIQ
jgi:signal peptidase I